MRLIKLLTSRKVCLQMWIICLVVFGIDQLSWHAGNRSANAAPIAKSFEERRQEIFASIQSRYDRITKEKANGTYRPTAFAVTGQTHGSQ